MTHPQCSADIEDVADIIRDKVYADENDKVGGVYDAAQKVIEYVTVQAAQPPGAFGYAQRLATILWEKHWKDDAPEWKPLPDIVGVLTQIDNMVAGLSRPPTRNTIVNAFAFEAALLLPYVYWLKLLQAHNEFMEDLTNA